MINVNRLTKLYGPHVAVDDVSFSCPPGILTGQNCVRRRGGSQTACETWFPWTQ
jgi:ABC-type phosphonate transport system ATPase subunit